MALRFDGLYCCITRGSDGFRQNSTFRFYEDGGVIHATVGETPRSTGVFPLPQWFQRESPRFSGSKGTYEVDGNDIAFTCTSVDGSVAYRGTVTEDGLFLTSHSGINGHEAEYVGYTFHPFSKIDGWRQL